MNNFKLDFHFFKINEVEHSIKNFINKHKCSEFEADISPLNLIEASRVAILCSAYHFAMFPEGRVFWDLKDEQTAAQIAKRKLKNMELRVKTVESLGEFVKIGA